MVGRASRLQVREMWGHSNGYKWSRFQSYNHPDEHSSLWAVTFCVSMCTYTRTCIPGLLLCTSPFALHPPSLWLTNLCLSSYSYLAPPALSLCYVTHCSHTAPVIGDITTSFKCNPQAAEITVTFEVRRLPLIFLSLQSACSFTIAFNTCIMYLLFHFPFLLSFQLYLTTQVLQAARSLSAAVQESKLQVLSLQAIESLKLLINLIVVTLSMLRCPCAQAWAVSLLKE